MDQDLTILTKQLIELTGGWNQHDEIGAFNEGQVKEIGRKLCNLNGMQAMQDAYYEAKKQNKYAALLNYVWDGIGDWRA